MQMHCCMPHLIQSRHVSVISALMFIFFTYYQFYYLMIIYAYNGLQDCVVVMAPTILNFVLYYSEYYRTFAWVRDNFPNKLEMAAHIVQLVLAPNHGFTYTPAGISHTCNNVSGYSVRHEVDLFKALFNSRIKFIVIRSMFVGYYGSLVPVFLLSADHEYDQFWILQHVVVGWLCTAFMLTSHFYSPQFYDTLHQASLHLGKWQKLEQRNCIVPCFTWTDGSIYGPGIVVRHSKEYYKSEANMTCAEPGNPGHYRFYVCIRRPWVA